MQRDVRAAAADMSSASRSCHDTRLRWKACLAREIIHHGAHLAYDRDLAGEIQMMRMQQTVEAAAAARAANRLH